MTQDNNSDLAILKRMLDKAGISYEVDMYKKAGQEQVEDTIIVTVERGYAGFVTDFYFSDKDESLKDMGAFE